MKTQKTYSLNVEVVKAFELETGNLNKSELLEALMIKFLVEYSRAKK